MARRRASGGTPATLALERTGVRFTLHHYRHDPKVESFGLEAAERLGLEPGSVFKTLLADVDGELTVAVVPVTARLDLKALAAVRGGKRAVLAEPVVAERATGYVVGGISPFGQRRALPTVLDASALALTTIYVSGGKRGLDLGLCPQDLVDVLQASVAAVARS